MVILRSQKPERLARNEHSVAINKAGTLALVANRAEDSFTVLAIDGKNVKPIGTVSVATQPTAAVASPPPALPVAVAITPDGKLVRGCSAEMMLRWFALDSPLEGTGFEPSVPPFGRAGADRLIRRRADYQHEVGFGDSLSINCVRFSPYCRRKFNDDFAALKDVQISAFARFRGNCGSHSA